MNLAGTWVCGPFCVTWDETLSCDDLLPFLEESDCVTLANSAMPYSSSVSTHQLEAYITPLEH